LSAFVIFFIVILGALALFAHGAKTPRERGPKNSELMAGDVAATTNPSTNATSGPTATRATSGPSTNASTSAPSTTQSAANKPFPKVSSSLLSRSLYTRGAPPSGKPGGGDGPPGGPEANLGLRGVLVLDGKFAAIVEDNASKKAQEYKAGDSVGPGKVKSITIDAMEYQNGPTSRTVAIGQNLLGMPLPPQPPPQPKQPPQGTQPGQPQPGQPGQPQPGQIPPEVMRQMRRGK
jgi:hypothetical protein